MARTKKRSVHYVDNSKFSTAVVEYCTIAEKSKSTKTEIPKVPDYIAHCFWGMREGLSLKGNF